MNNQIWEWEEGLQWVEGSLEATNQIIVAQLKLIMLGLFFEGTFQTFLHVRVCEHFPQKHVYLFR